MQLFLIIYVNEQRPSNIPPMQHSARPVPMPGGAGSKAQPFIPKPDFRMKEVPTKKQPEITVESVLATS